MDDRKVRIGTRWKLKIADKFRHYVGIGIDVKENNDDKVVGEINGIPVDGFGNIWRGVYDNQTLANDKKIYDKVIFGEYGIKTKYLGGRLRNDFNVRVEHHKFGHRNTDEKYNEVNGNVGENDNNYHTRKYYLTLDYKFRWRF